MREVKLLEITEETYNYVFVFDIEGARVEVEDTMFFNDSGLTDSGRVPKFWEADIDAEYVELEPEWGTTQPKEHTIYKVHPHKMAWQDGMYDEFYDERFEMLRLINEALPWDYDVDLEMESLSADFEVIYVDD